MKQREVFNKIGGILKELSDQYEYLKTADEPLNELELELFLANSHFLTDHMIILSKLNAQAAARKEPEIKPEPEAPKITPPEPVKNTAEPRYFEPLVQSVPAPKNPLPEVKKQEEPETAETQSFTFDAIEPISEATNDDDTIRHELIMDEADMDEEDELLEEPIDMEEEKEVEPEPEPIAVKAAEVPVQEIQFPEPVKIPEPVRAPEPVAVYEPVKTPEKETAPLTLNERMSAQFTERNKIAEQGSLQPVSDLKAAINLNDKLLYVKDLFNGYSLAYSEAIEILNRFSSFEEADLFLKKNYVAKNNWEGKPETTEKFYSILKRRYA